MVHRDVSGSALAHSVNILRKQTEMDRLANKGAHVTALVSEAEEEKKGKPYVSHAQPRRIKSLGRDISMR